MHVMERKGKEIVCMAWHGMARQDKAWKSITSEGMTS